MDTYCKNYDDGAYRDTIPFMLVSGSTTERGDKRIATNELSRDGLEPEQCAPNSTTDSSRDTAFEISGAPDPAQDCEVYAQHGRNAQARSSLATPVAGTDLLKTRHRSSEIMVGSVVDNRYEILAEIARGGFGIVYRARQLGLNRIVALKRLLSQADVSIVERFLLEADIIKDLIHPNTIHLIDAGTDNNHLYIVMEYINGESLSNILNKTRALSPLRAIHVTKQILKSINEAHQRGIVHRDLKPSNILIRNVIGEPDFVKVLDFGIAKVQSAGCKKLTRDGKIMGTPQYLAPEVFHTKHIGASADLFAVGLIMYEMVVGKPLLPQDIGELVRVSIDPKPYTLDGALAGTPMADFFKRALEKRPERRFLNAIEMIAALEALEKKMRVHTEQKDIRYYKSWRTGLFILISMIMVANIIFLSLIM